MDKDVIKDALASFKCCLDNEDDNRKAALDDLKFARLGEQWSAADIEQRRKERRPALTINRLPSFIRQIVNDARQNKPSIKILPNDSSADPQTAKIIEGLIRNIETSSYADIAYDTAIDSAVTSGLGYIRVVADYARNDTFEQDIMINRVSDPFSIYGDPYSNSAISDDWNLAFVTEMLERGEFQRRYKNADPVNWEDARGTDLALTWADEKLVRLAEYWAREEIPEKVLLMNDGTVIKEVIYLQNKGLFDASQVVPVQDRLVHSYQVTQRIMTGKEVLEENKWPGEFIPIVPVYGEEVIVEGKRHFRSLIRDAKDAQRMYNYWRTSSTELVALAPKAPWVGRKGAFDHDDKWETANSESHSYLEYEGNEMPQRIPFSGVPAGALQEALNASDDMKSIMGLFDASLGAKSNETSGKAIMARQREGDISTFHFIDNLNRSIRHLGAIIVDLIPHFYNRDRIIRILAEDGKPESIPLNKPVTQPDGTLRIYDLSAGKYDVVVKSGPSFTSRREEAATQMMELVRQFPDAAPVIGDIIAKNLDWPGAEEIEERLKAINPVLNKQEQGDDPAVAAKKIELEMKQQEAQQDMAIRAQKMQFDREELEIKKQKAQIEANIDIEKHRAEMTAMREKSMQSMYGPTEKRIADDGTEIEIRPLIQTLDAMTQANTSMMQMSLATSESIAKLSSAVEALSVAAQAPKEIVRDAQGRPVAVKPIIEHMPLLQG